MASLEELAGYRFAGKGEQAVREEWIAPLLVHLGYAGDTLNDIQYERSLRLAKPFRRIGRQRVDVDYVPTVLGKGLWILEAKAAASEDWDDAISQAWLYATHPEIDVPFMAIADGSRFAVYDTTQADWDRPECDFPTPDLITRFEELRAVLGADHVTGAIRSRRLRHLGLAMNAEIAVERLDDYVREVQRLATEARPAVLENYRTVIRDQFATERRIEEDALSARGTFAVGVWANRPFGVPVRMMGLGRDALLREEPADRDHAFRQLAAATHRGIPRVAREFWNFRLVRLFIALRCADEEGCEFLGPIAKQAVRDHLLNFPDDAVARAAHRLERVLPIFAGRLLRATGVADLDGLARRVQQHWSDDVRARRRVDGDRLYVAAVSRITEVVWDRTTWDADALNTGAGQLEAALERIEVKPTGFIGLAHDPHFEWQYETDQLEMSTLYELGSMIKPEHLSDEIEKHLEAIVRTEGADQTRLVQPAQSLLSRYRAGPEPAS